MLLLLGVWILFVGLLTFAVFLSVASGSLGTTGQLVVAIWLISLILILTTTPKYDYVPSKTLTFDIRGALARPA